MARQTGIIKLKGTIGDISFYKTGDGHLTRNNGCCRRRGQFSPEIVSG